MLLAGDQPAEEMDPYIAALLRGTLDPPPAEVASAEQSTPCAQASQLGARHTSSAEVVGEAVVSAAIAAPAAAKSARQADHEVAEAAHFPRPRLSLAERMRQYQKK